VLRFSHSSVILTRGDESAMNPWKISQNAVEKLIDATFYVVRGGCS
jgi:hypothetical protein